MYGPQSLPLPSLLIDAFAINNKILRCIYAYECCLTSKSVSYRLIPSRINRDSQPRSLCCRHC